MWFYSPNPYFPVFIENTVIHLSPKVINISFCFHIQGILSVFLCKTIKHQNLKDVKKDKIQCSLISPLSTFPRQSCFDCKLVNFSDITHHNNFICSLVAGNNLYFCGCILRGGGNVRGLFSAMCCKQNIVGLIYQKKSTVNER